MGEDRSEDQLRARDTKMRPSCPIFSILGPQQTLLINYSLPPGSPDAAPEPCSTQLSSHCQSEYLRPE